ncbi:hypothetical protein OV207_12315 [Corallococcus sp. BB11-1]|uniref:hypothetical protein n=1 Tax=Corallococcus sp. BB11-1 TaxID=2996783 RepID=UPI00227168AD|nr:hypothetical protein [Corallococcus sp. BB11-1]MCY1032245.1 hypothetical protein [Corallococcus sp. BB11-1]
MARDKSPLDVLKRMRATSGASLADCAQALKASQGSPRIALNHLAAQGHTGGRPGYDEAAPLGSYGFDTYAQRVADTCVQEIKGVLKPGGAPLSAVVLHAPEGIPVALVSLYSGEWGPHRAPLVSIDVAPAAAPIPDTPGAPDPLLETFRYRFGFQETRPDVGLFDEEPALYWEVSSLPDSVFCLEMMKAAVVILRRLARDGYPASHECVAGYARSDLLLRDPRDQRDLIQRQLRTTLRDREALSAFARLCYAELPGQQGLLELAAGA